MKTCPPLRLLGLLTAVFAAASAIAQKPAAPVNSLRVYLFDCGIIHGEKPADYGLNPGDVKNPDMVVPCYLVVHPKGTLMWDVGVVPDKDFHGDQPATGPDESESAPKPLLPQLAALGYPAASITYIAFSHYHFDHTANANAFSASTWLVHPAERDAMFAASADHVAAYDRLRNSKTKLLPATDYDVFGDGSVVIKYAPGHTPGHQVLALQLPKTGSVLIAGDLWHYVAERNSLKAPEGEANPRQTLASRATMEAWLKDNNAQLWIEHDPGRFNRLPKAPKFIE